MSLPDYYRVLGVSRTAKSHGIKAAYRRLARRYHPDLRPNDPRAEETFKSINQAYSVLGDGPQRRLYDAQTTPVSTIAYTAPARPITRAPYHATASHSPVHSQHAQLKVFIKAVFLLGLISLLAVLAYIVLFQ